jgi:uncharacterized low-complexity protein
MSDQNKLNPLAVALGTTFAISLASSPIVNAADNPFAANQLTNGGYEVAEGKCGEGKCGDKKGEGSCGDKKEEGKCGEGKCGDKKGEGSCGDKKEEGKCGEGKCGDKS